MDAKPKKVIVSTDGGWDDVLSLLYLMKTPAIEIVGVVVTGCGETNLRWGTVIAQTLMELGNQTQATVAVGTSTPLKFDHVFPQLFRNDMNIIMGLLGTLNPETEIDLDSRPAWQFISETLDQADDKIAILSLGGFTNLAKMLELYPDTKVGNIEGVYAMAGAIYVDGNVAVLNNAKPEWNQGPIYSTNTYAEWNVFVDPLAAKIVFDSGIPVTIVPLDACDYVVLDAEYVNKITATDPLATLAKSVFEKKTGSHSEGVPVPIFDPLAAVIMAGGMTGYQSHCQYLDVDLTETDGDTVNRCGKIDVVESGSRKVTIVQGVSQTAFSTNYSKVINGPLLK